MKNKLYRVSLIISGSISLLILVLTVLGFLEGLEQRFLDTRFNLRGTRKPAASIVIVNIDEESIKKLGRWPWPREYHGRLVNTLVKDGVKTVAFDVFFTEEDKRNLASDQVLVDATRNSKRVVHNAFFSVDQGEPVALDLPMPALRNIAAGIGYANVFPEMDGVVRKLPTVLEFEGKSYYHLSVMAAANYLDIPPEELVKDIPVEKTSEYMKEYVVNYAGGFGTFPYISYADVLNGEFEKETFKNKLVVVGTTAAGLFDRHPQAFSPVFPGVETQANGMDNIIQKVYIKMLPLFWTIITILIWGVVAGFVLPRVTPLICSILAPVFIIVYFLFTFLLFNMKLWLQFVPAALVILFSFAFIIIYRVLTEEREKSRLKKSFQSYVSPAVLDEIINNPSALALGGVRKRLTVLFSDIRNFTTMTEASQPEDVVKLLNDYLDRMTEVVFKYGGTLDKFIGDAVMAFWGAPIPQKDHSERAVRCAIEMIEQLVIFQEEMKAKGKPVIDIGVGINTGDMIVGNMGSARRMDYTVIGDTVNLASRLEGLNKNYGTHIIIGSETYNEVSSLNYFECKPLGEAKVKGKEILTQIYEVKGWKQKPE